MMNGKFRLNTVALALCVVYPTIALGVTDCYPSLPLALSASVAPNVLLHIDNSGSMAQKPNIAAVKTKIQSARDVATALVTDKKNAGIRWGIFSFNPNSNETGGILQAPVGSDEATLTTVISGLGAQTWTPLGEASYEMTRYWAGEPSFYRNNINYVSPIQYRCQKNFNIIITDGVATKDNNIPGTPQAQDSAGTSFADGVSYTSYNVNNVAVTNTFKVCRSTATVSSVTCPATVEGYVAPVPLPNPDPNSFIGTKDEPANLNPNNFGRAVRDVAMFAYDKDMRVGGNDLDGKSFDDPKFLKQNVRTYTVGFAVNDPVLKAAAIVGRGEYYTAESESDLTKALGTVVSSIIASISNAGGVAPSSGVLTSGNKLFQPIYSPKGWYGELRCFDLDSTGLLITACTPNAKAVIPAEASRTVFSGKVVAGTTTPFEFKSSQLALMSTAQTTALGTTDPERTNVINFVRGSTVGGFRTRPDGLLGDIVDAQPTVVVAPDGETPDTDYPAFKTANASRNMVFVGANDGMLHGFDVSNMTEFMGYVPSPVYPGLKRLTSTDYGESSASPHTYFVNGALRKQDVKLSGGWRTLLVGGLGQGGQGYFALDASNQGSLTTSPTSAVKWEFTDQSDSSLGYTFGAPIIYNVRTSSSTAVPAVILANGYDSDWSDGTVPAAKKSTLFVVKADTGEVLKKIEAPSGTGLSAPVGVDFGQDGVLDYVYAGDIEGKLWRFDLTASTPAGFTVASTPIFDAGATHPITMRPAVKAVTKADGTPVGNLILFGTGKLLTEADRTDKTVQAFYGVLDKMEVSPTTVARANLIQRTVLNTATVSGGGYLNGTFRKISTLPTLDLTADGNTDLGWYLDLPVETERLVTAPILLSDKLLFGTGVTVSDEKCSPGKGWLMGLNPMTGSVTQSSRNKDYSYIDIKLDEKSTTEDKVAFSSGSAYASGVELDGIPTELTFVAKAQSLFKPASVGGELGNAGASIAMQEANLMGVYTGNAPAGVGAGNSIGRSTVGGGGFIYAPVTGDVGAKPFTGLGASGGIKVETATWRELK